MLQFSYWLKLYCIIIWITSILQIWWGLMMTNFWRSYLQLHPIIGLYIGLKIFIRVIDFLNFYTSKYLLLFMCQCFQTTFINWKLFFKDMVGYTKFFTLFIFCVDGIFFVTCLDWSSGFYKYFLICLSDCLDEIESICIVSLPKIILGSSREHYQTWLRLVY